MTLTPESRKALLIASRDIPVRGVDAATRVRQLIQDLTQGRDPSSPATAREVAQAAIEAGIQGGLAALLLDVLDTPRETNSMKDHAEDIREEAIHVDIAPGAFAGRGRA